MTQTVIGIVIDIIDPVLVLLKLTDIDSGPVSSGRTLVIVTQPSRTAMTNWCSDQTDQADQLTKTERTVIDPADGQMTQPRQTQTQWARGPARTIDPMDNQTAQWQTDNEDQCVVWRKRWTQTDPARTVLMTDDPRPRQYDPKKTEPGHWSDPDGQLLWWTDPIVTDYWRPSWTVDELMTDPAQTQAQPRRYCYYCYYC